MPTLSGSLPFTDSTHLAPGDSIIYNIAVPSAACVYIVPEVVSGRQPLQGYSMHGANFGDPEGQNVNGGVGCTKKVDPDVLAANHAGKGSGMNVSSARTCFLTITAHSRNTREGGFRLMVVSGHQIPAPDLLGP